MTFQRRTPMIQTSQIHHCRKCGASKVLPPVSATVRNANPRCYRPIWNNPRYRG
jgi:hypothetical protein